MPFCLGLTIPYLSTYTANDKWEKEFITKKDVCNKALMLDDFCLYLNFGEDMFYESLTKDFDVENLSTEDKKVINKTKGAERRQQFEIMKYKYFIEDSNRGLHKNSYLIHKFWLQSRLKLNKNPEANNLPQVDLNLILGGKFVNKYSDERDQMIDIRFQQQQLIAILKFLEYSGYYTKFQDTVNLKYNLKCLHNVLLLISLNWLLSF